MSRWDDRDRSRTRRRRDRSRKARRRDCDPTPVPDGMDWSNPMTWQHNQNLNLASSFPQPLNHYQPHPPPAQIHHSAPCLPQYTPVNYMMPFPPEPAPAMKTTMVPADNPQGRQLEPAAATGQPAPLPVQIRKAWLIPPEEWQPGDGLLDKTMPRPLLQWLLCGGWSPSTAPSSRTRRSAFSL